MHKAELIPLFKGDVMNKEKYRYYAGCIYESYNGKTYLITIPSPYFYSSEKEALQDNKKHYRYYLTINKDEYVIIIKQPKAVESSIHLMLNHLAEQTIAEYTYDALLNADGEILSTDKKDWSEDDFKVTNDSFDTIFQNTIHDQQEIRLDADTYEICVIN